MEFKCQFLKRQKQVWLTSARQSLLAGPGLALGPDDGEDALWQAEGASPAPAGSVRASLCEAWHPGTAPAELCGWGCGGPGDISMLP